MQKQLGAIFLIAGTCIGSGMIALPIMLAKIGIIPSLILMFLTWGVVYYTSLISVELNLQAGRGETLGKLARLFSGKWAEFTGTLCFKILSYALMAVYVYAGSSVIQKMINSYSGNTYNFEIVAITYSILAIFLLMLPIKFLDYVNRFLFIGLLAVIALLVCGLILLIDWNNLPLIVKNNNAIISLRHILPILFTAFGFQVIFHTLTNYCNKNKKMLKRAFFWGSLIPAVVYMIWTSSILAVVYDKNPLFYKVMSEDSIEIGALVEELSRISKWSLVQMLVWWITFLTIITSVVGVGAGLKDSIMEILSKNLSYLKFKSFIAAFLTIFPGFIIAILVPNAFIKVLGFAGMILVIIAIIIPAYLLIKIYNNKFNYKELKSKFLIITSVIIGIVIICCEILNLF